MTRAQLEHIIRAAGAIANVQDLVVIGSQAVLGQFPNAPDELLVSNEADVFPRGDAALSDVIDGSIGEGSPFQREFGYYAHGVDETTAILPDGWRDRLILVTGENTRFVRGWCLEINDLAVSKYAAGREKDLDFTRTLARYRLVTRETLERRVALTTSIDSAMRGRILARIQRDFAEPA
ncbi:MAG TPA: DUF6036 family nucleotidyltransferase [Candidatus Limnocylindrales bacterium]|nr:DUF6036 family nucleotidyltransferase [Candidatus Limnocylindrales bacterium]